MNVERHGSRILGGAAVLLTCLSIFLWLDLGHVRRMWQEQQREASRMKHVSMQAYAPDASMPAYVMGHGGTERDVTMTVLDLRPFPGPERDAILRASILIPDQPGRSTPAGREHEEALLAAVVRDGVMRMRGILDCETGSFRPIEMQASRGAGGAGTHQMVVLGPGRLTMTRAERAGLCER